MKIGDGDHNSDGDANSDDDGDDDNGNPKSDHNYHVNGSNPHQSIASLQLQLYSCL